MHNEIQTLIDDLLNKSVIITPEIIQDLIDGFEAKQAEAQGILSVEETEIFLNSLRNS